MAVKRRKPDNREHREQVALFVWAEMSSAAHPELKLLFAIPNGGQRHPAVAKKLKAEGVKPGIPDTLLPVARGGYHGLFVEMKAEGGRESKHQKEKRQALTEQGYKSVVCWGFDEARKAIMEYLQQ